MSYRSYKPVVPTGIAGMEQVGCEAEARDGHRRSGQGARLMPGGADGGCADSADLALQQAPAGLRGGAGVQEFQAGIEAGQRLLGNRAFVRRVEALQSRGQDAATPDPAAPLQMMPKRKKDQGVVQEGSGPEAEAEADNGEAGSTNNMQGHTGAGIAEAQAAEVPVEENTKIQVALNTLRGEGIGAFCNYLEAEIGEEALLYLLVERIARAEDLGEVQAEALVMLDERFHLLDSEQGAGAPEAVKPTLRQCRGAAEAAVIAPVKSELTQGERELFEACFRGVTERVGLLLKDGNIDINVANDYGTLLCHAAFHGHADIVRELLQAPDIDVNLAQQDGATPLHLAVQEGHVKVVERLLDKHGIKADLVTSAGLTPLTIAVQKGHTELVKLLLSNGADPNLTGVAGLAPLHAASIAGDTAIVEMLLHSGADQDAEAIDRRGRAQTPAGLAEHGGHCDVMSVLELYRLRREAAHRLEWLLKTEQVEGGTGAPPPVTEVEVETDAVTACVPTIPPMPSRPGGAVPGTEPPTTVAQAKDALRHEVLGKLLSDYIDQQECIQLLEAFNIAADLDSLCVLYAGLAHIERARRRGRAATAAPVFDLGGKTGLAAEDMEREMKHYLGQAYHRYVCQAVNDMEFGKGKPAAAYPGLLHAAAGVPGMGSCSVFYYLDGSGDRKRIRVVGIGHQVGRGAYRLDYAAAELGAVGRVLRID